MLWLVFLYLLIPKTEPGIWKKTVCLVRGWVDGWMGESALPGGNDSSAMVSAACGGVGRSGQWPAHPTSGSGDQGLPSLSSVQILPLIKRPDTVSEEI